MKKFLTCVFVLAFAVPGGAAFAAAPSAPVDDANINLEDTASLQRGAEYFFQYCIGCHSLEHARYNRIGQDLGLTDEQVAENFVHTRDASGDATGVGQLIKIAMRPDDAEEWFAQPAPDLTLTARHRGPDWIYTMLRNFYLDDSRPLGVNNATFQAMGMPHVLWELQGWQKNVGEDGEIKLELAEEGKMSTAEYDEVVRDITAFMTYVSEPIRMEREAMGTYVIWFLIVFTILAYLLKKEYWRDVH